MSLLIHSAWLGGSPHFLAAVLDEGFAMFGLFAFGEGHTRKRSFFLSADDVAKERAMKPIERAGGGD